MATVAPPLLLQLAKDWKTSCGLKSAVFSGCVGDRAHAAKGGYHISRQDQPSNNYSVVRPDDKGGPANTASALDMSMNASDMRLCTNRLVAVFNNPNDPRRKYINAFNGTTDSKNARRWDVYARKVKAATSDHLSHVHLEVRRQYVGSAVAMKAILSALKGESVSGFLASIKQAASTVKSSSSTPAFPGTLRRLNSQASPNASVRALQQQLAKRGMSVAADGYFGPRLESVVRAWQSSHGLGADGIVGPKTWASVFAGK